jgi:hypothetical protein
MNESRATYLPQQQERRSCCFSPFFRNSTSLWLESPSSHRLFFVGGRPIIVSVSRKLLLLLFGVPLCLLIVFICFMNFRGWKQLESTGLLQHTTYLSNPNQQRNYPEETDRTCGAGERTNKNKTRALGVLYAFVVYFDFATTNQSAFIFFGIDVFNIEFTLLAGERKR